MPVHKNKAFVSQSGITIAGADTDPDDIANAMHKRMSRVSRRTRKNQAAKAEMELSPQRLVQMRTDWDAGWEKKIRTGKFTRKLVRAYVRHRYCHCCLGSTRVTVWHGLFICRTLPLAGGCCRSQVGNGLRRW